MNLRLGFARLARVLAVLYGVGALIAVWIAVADTPQVEATQPKPITIKTKQGRCYSINAPSQAEAERLLINHVRDNPSELQPHAADAPNYERLSCLVLPQSFETPMRFDWQRAARNGALTAVWAAAGFALLWGFYAGLRWVALGFMAPKTEPRQ